MNIDEEDWLGKGWPVGSLTPENPTRLEKAKLFLQFRVDDAFSAEEIREERFDSTPNQEKKDASYLESLEWLAHETPDGISLVDIVKWDANYVIETGTNELENPKQAEYEAKMWILEFAEFVREILGEKSPPRKYPVLVVKPRKYFFPE